jgi:hypothetical protein
MDLRLRAPAAVDGRSTAGGGGAAAAGGSTSVGASGALDFAGASVGGKTEQLFSARTVIWPLNGGSPRREKNAQLKYE